MSGPDSSSTDAVRYRIEPADLAAHRFRVTLTLPAPDVPEQEFWLPVWIPGSYLVREFARHLSLIEAHQGDRACGVRALSKNRWAVATQGDAALTVTYQVYAFDASVRAAWLDGARGFFNPSSLCLAAAGREAARHRVELRGWPAGWDVATALRAVDTDTGTRIETSLCIQAWNFEAADYDELIDHPFELGSFWRGAFEAGGRPHELVVGGAWPRFDGERLLRETRSIVEAQIRFWHGDQPPPYERYVFLLQAADSGYGGLEHRASTALIASRKDLPRQGEAGLSDGHLGLLGLISHEFFHTWNVKRLKPASFLPYDLHQENYTELLWFFEGFTSYYDDLFLRRAGLVDVPRYLGLVARTLNGVAALPGQSVQSLAEASFDAWIKYYRADENTPNATVSYYTKGALVGLLLDLALREAGSSLDAVMHSLWREAPGGGVTEALILDTVRRLGGAPVAEALRAWVHGRQPLEVRPALERAGIALLPEALTLAAEWGLRVSEGPVTGVQVKSVLAGGPASRAGVSAGDELLAVDGWRVRRLDDAVAWLAPGAACDLLVVREQRLTTLRLPPRTPEERTRAAPLTLWPDAAASAEAVARRRAWLGADA